MKLKRTFLSALCALLLGFQAQAQTTAAKWDSTYRPAAYELKVAQFKSYPNAANDIVFLGNSITANTDWAELLGMSNVKNRGISGDITFGVLERLDEVIEGKPAKVFILIGINDISRNIPDHVITANHRKMVARIKAGSPKTRIYFQTLMPVNNTFDKFKNHYNKDEHIAAVNQGIKDLAKKEKIEVIDLHPHFLDSEKRLVKEYTHDGLHLTVAGYQKWVEVLKKGNYLK
ncbi:GDSL-type esterase/lipase family protein [Rufibacter quisquiliarum]|uniref:Lysophospholipase L1-like esterase n=1 Tax=Rufibacter quisquiliarum TaxID=1549639 RepID=A0A839GDZ1_9BACT|nr:GDSL-type esterase/lipase family protein [Rufibacter quisquiliarum]MBA9076650.1 lysophospholipase L1-like esterase [Rufibacter quisquiliarum]